MTSPDFAILRFMQSLTVQEILSIPNVRECVLSKYAPQIVEIENKLNWCDKKAWEKGEPKLRLITPRHIRKFDNICIKCGLSRNNKSKDSVCSQCKDRMGLYQLRNKV